MFTTAPGIQVYTATALDGSLVGHGRKPFCKHGAVALEAQHFPNAVNFPQFPSPFVKAGEHYRQVTVFAFSAG